MRLAERGKKLKKGKLTYLPKLAEHVWDMQHKTLWDQVDIVVLEINNNKRKAIEAPFMAAND